MTGDAEGEASRAVQPYNVAKGLDATLATDPNSQSQKHEHRSCRADERLWLEALPDEAATIRLHSFCVDCGGVRSALPMRGRPMGFFERALSNLKANLEDNPRYPKLAQVHSHRIAKALASIPDFDDPYTMPYETQWRIFVDAVQRVRPDLDIDFIEQALPREPRRHRPTVLELMTSLGREKDKTAGIG